MKYLLVLCVLFSSFATSNGFAQNNKTIEITGVVTDDKNEPLVGANVVVKDIPGLGAITDMNGRYKIKVEPYNKLLFSYIGFKTEEVVVQKETVINVVLTEAEASVLDEVVITGTGAQKKINLTGAVTAADVEVLKSNPSASITNALAGNVAGVMAWQRSGQPGQNTSEFWIRGISTFGASTSALVLVDGFERSLYDINIEDVESFQVLKDASETAIYGSRGANGVVLVTTKHGKSTKININGKVETIYNQLIKVPEYANGYEYATMLNEARITRNQPPVYEEDELLAIKYGLDPDLYPSVDWADVILRDGAMGYRANVNLDGGGARARYFVSVSYVEDQGMYKTDDELAKIYNTNANARRYNYRMNGDMDLTQTTLLRIGISGMLKKVNDSGKGTSVIWNSLTGQNPVQMPVVYSNGYYPGFNVSDIRDNPWVAATQTGYRQSWTNEVQTNVTLEQNFDFITKGLKFIGRLGYDTNNNNSIQKIRQPERWTAERFRDDNGEIVFRRVNAEQLLTQIPGTGTGDRREFLEAELHYNRGFGDHHTGVTLKYNQDSKVQTYNLGTDLKNSVPYRHQGFAGRFTYDWKRRYYANFNFGYTGSENFAKGNQFGFFPAVSFAWNISEEPLIKKRWEWMEMLKLRYSWGRVGNDNVGTRFPYLYTISEGMSGYQWADFDFSRTYGGMSYSAVASTGITWEIATKHDAGIDVSIFGDKFSITADYFNEKREGIFMSRTSLPWIVGLNPGDNPKANVGSVLSQGADGNFAFKQKIGNVNITLRGNATFSKNEILERDEGFKNFPYQYDKGLRVNQRKGYIALGLFKDWEDIRNSPDQTSWGKVWPGDIKYKDVNGNGVIGAEDVVAIGATAQPNLIYGAGASAQWKGVDFNIHFQGAGKSHFFLAGGIAHPFSRGQWGNVLKDVVANRWISQDISGDPATENPNATYPRLEYENVSGNNRQSSTFWLRDASYLRLKTLEMGYSLPKNFINKFNVNKMRLFFIGTNVLTFSEFKLWDPEAGSTDGGGYPLTKSYTVGLTINL
ncbi:MAG: TonB-dependent receptor [Dysgonamonadaceae bacterium]|jgi:TonB-linked SusC/RagA family outer membrane protein|nr:TonB-dependent receptor [Dysgonamonadaceae bacterium]